MAHTPQRRWQSFEKYFSKVCHPGSWIWRPYFRFWFLFLLCRSPKMMENVEILERQNIASGGFTGWFLGPRGPLVLPLVGPCAVRLQEFLLLLLLLLLHTRSHSPMVSGHPCHPGDPPGPVTHDNPEEPASCKWSSGGAGLLQIIIWGGRPLANDHPEGPASCTW